MITYDTGNMIYQNFAFPTSVVDYIMKHANAPVLFKLYKTSKYFYYKMRLTVVKDLDLYYKTSCNIVTSKEQTLSICCNINYPEYHEFGRLWISDSITCVCNESSFVDLTMIAKNTVKKLVLEGIFELDKFKFLIQSPLLSEVHVPHLIDEKKNLYLDDHEVFALLPDHVTSVVFNYTGDFTNESLINLISLKPGRKFKKLWINGLPLDVNAMLVAQFIKVYADPDVDYHFELDHNEYQAHLLEPDFLRLIEDDLGSWKCKKSD